MLLFDFFNKKGFYMKKNYETMVVDVLRIEEDVVRCSNEYIYEHGDKVGKDIF